MSRKRPASLFSRCLCLLVPIILIGATVPGGGIRLRVTAEQANVREKPDIMSAVLRQIPEGAILEAERKEGEWYALLVEKEGGGSSLGYVHESLVMIIEQPPPEPLHKKDQVEEKPPVKPDPAEKTKGPGSTSPQAPRTPVATEYKNRLRAAFWLGGRQAAVGDLNDGAQGLAGYYGARLSAAPGSEVQPVHFGYHLGAEVRLSLASRLCLSFGAEYSSGEAASSIVYKGASPEASYSAKPGFSAASVCFGLLYYPLPYLYVRAGLDYAFAHCAYFYRFSYPRPGEPTDFWQEWTGAASSSGLGYELGLGLEWPLGRRLSLIAEAAWRSGRMNDLEGEDHYQESTNYESRERGTLYDIRATAGGTETFPLVFVRDREPAEAGVMDVRKAELDLSGYTLRLGLQIFF